MWYLSIMNDVKSHFSLHWFFKMKTSCAVRWRTRFWRLTCSMRRVGTPLYQTTGSELRMGPSSQGQPLDPLVTHWLSCHFIILMVVIVKISLQLMTTQPVTVQLPQGFGGAEQKIAITFSLRDRIPHWMLPPSPHSDKRCSGACTVRPQKGSAHRPSWEWSYSALWGSVFHWVSGFSWSIAPTQQSTCPWHILPMSALRSQFLLVCVSVCVYHMYIHVSVCMCL